MINTNNPMLASYASAAQSQPRPVERASSASQGSSDASAPVASVEVSISQEALQAQQADAARAANAQSETGNNRQVNAAAETADTRNDLDDTTTRQASDAAQAESLTDGQQEVGLASAETLG